MAKAISCLFLSCIVSRLLWRWRVYRMVEQYLGINPFLDGHNQDVGVSDAFYVLDDQHIPLFPVERAE